MTAVARIAPRTLASSLLLLSVLCSQTAWPQPVDHFRFKGSHNAYNRTEPGGIVPVNLPLWKQVLTWNAYAIELDLVRALGGLRVAHVAAECATGCRLLATELQELTEMPEVLERVTFVRLELKQSVVDHYTPESIEEAILDAFDEAGVSLSMIFTLQDFEDYDDSNSWPSYSELLKMGKRIVVLGGVMNGATNEKFFKAGFESTTARHVVSRGYDSERPGLYAAGDDGRPTPGDDKLWSVWPDCDVSIVETSACPNRTTWDAARDAGFNLLNNNHVREHYTMGDGTFPPWPMYVEPPADDFEFQIIHGTYGFPAHSINQADDRINANRSYTRGSGGCSPHQRGVHRRWLRSSASLPGPGGARGAVLRR